MQRIAFGEADVEQEVNGIVQICRSASVKVHGLIYRVGFFEIYVEEKIDGIVQIYVAVVVYVAGGVGGSRRIVRGDLEANG